MSNRKVKDIDREKIQVDLLSSELCQNTPGTLNELVNSYNTTIAYKSDTLQAISPLVQRGNQGSKAGETEG